MWRWNRRSEERELERKKKKRWIKIMQRVAKTNHGRNKWNWFLPTVHRKLLTTITRNQPSPYYDGVIWIKLKYLIISAHSVNYVEHFIQKQFASAPRIKSYINGRLSVYTHTRIEGRKKNNGSWIEKREGLCWNYIYHLLQKLYMYIIKRIVSIHCLCCLMFVHCKSREIFKTFEWISII